MTNEKQKEELLQKKQNNIKKLRKINKKLDLVEDRLKEIQLDSDLNNISD